MPRSQLLNLWGILLVEDILPSQHLFMQISETVTGSAGVLHGESCNIQAVIQALKLDVKLFNY